MAKLTMKSPSMVALVGLVLMMMAVVAVDAACVSDFQVTAAYDKTAVYPNALQATYSIEDTTGNPGTSVTTLRLTINIAAGCGLTYVSASCGSYNPGTGVWNLDGVLGLPATAGTTCTVTYQASPSTTNTCASSIAITSNSCTNSLATTASANVSPRIYLGVPMADQIFVYFSTDIKWSQQNSQPGETWSIYLQKFNPATSGWGSFRSSRYQISAPNNANLLVANLPSGTTSYTWTQISNILPGDANLYRVVIKSSGSPQGQVVFNNGEDQFKLRIKPLRSSS